MAGFPHPVSQGEQTSRAQMRAGDWNHLSTNTGVDHVTEHKQKRSRLVAEAQEEVFVVTTVVGRRFS